MSLYGQVGFGQFPGFNQGYPNQAPMTVMTNPGAPLSHMGFIPPGQGLSMPAAETAKAKPPPAAANNRSAPKIEAPAKQTTIERALGGIMGANVRSGGGVVGSAQISQEQTEKLKDEVLSEVQSQLARKEARLESRWFELPSNTYGTAIWAVLVLEMEALNPLYLFKKPNDKTVPSDQRWNTDPNEEEGNFIVNWGRYRLSPFLVALFFQLSCVSLCFISWLVQFGFIFMLDQRIGGLTFFDLENSMYVCSTSGWVQLISVGFFLAFMMGQIPKVVKNIVIVSTANKETDETRGEEGARTLCITQTQLDKAVELHKKRQMTDDTTAQTLIDEAKGIPGVLQAALPAMKYIPRTVGNLRMRQVVSMIFPLAELVIISYLIYVGVKYIFWSGFASLEQSDNSHFPNYPADEPEWPWMSETQGVEEIIMATLALQFIMDIDEGIFEYVLPKSIQNSVAGTKLSCFGWLPAQFRTSDYIMVGKSMREEEIPIEGDIAQYPLGYERYKVMVELQKNVPSLMQDPVFLTLFKDAAASTIGECHEELNDWNTAKDEGGEDWTNYFEPDAKNYYQSLLDEARWLDDYYKMLPPGSYDQEEMVDKFVCSGVLQKLQNVPRSKRQHYWEDMHEDISEEFYEALTARPVRLKWLNLLPDATFIFTLFVIVLPVTLVFLVRAKMGCFDLPAVELDLLPAQGVGYWDGVARLWWVFVLFGILVAWRGFYLAKGVWKTSSEERDNMQRMKKAREERQRKKEERKKLQEEKKKEGSQKSAKPEGAGGYYEPSGHYQPSMSAIDEEASSHQSTEY